MEGVNLSAKPAVSRSGAAKFVVISEADGVRLLDAKLTADRTYYVRTDGSDSNDGLTNNSSGAFLTIQKAVDTVQGLDFDFNESIQVTIQVGDGTYAEALKLRGLRNMPGNDDPTAFPNSKHTKCVAIIGNEASPGSVIIAPPADGVPVLAQGHGAQWRLSGIKTNPTSFTSNPVWASFHAQNGALLVLRHVHDKNDSGKGSFISAYFATVRVMDDANISVEGDRHRFVFATFLSSIFFRPDTLIFVDTPAFSVGVFQSSDNSFLEAVVSGGNASITGSATGRMCVAEYNSHITHNWMLTVGDPLTNYCDASSSIQDGFAHHGATIWNEAIGAPSERSIAANCAGVYKNTGDGSARFYFNDAGATYRYVSLFAEPDVEAIEFVIDGAGSVITTGVKGDLEIPFPCTIQRVTVLADQSGSIVVDIWKDSYANFPPVDADSITASAPPTLASAAKSQDATLTGWSKNLAAGDVLRFNVDSAATLTRVTVSLKVVRTG